MLPATGKRKAWQPYAVASGFSFTLLLAIMSRFSFEGQLSSLKGRKITGNFRINIQLKAAGQGIIYLGLL